MRSALRPDLRYRYGRETRAALVQTLGGVVLVIIALHGAEEDGNMKNTGKRIFTAAAFFALANLPFIVMAGWDVTTR